MKGYSEVSIQNRGIYVAYKGEHYVVRNANTSRTTRMAKDEIIRKFHLHHDALDRHIAGGFKKSEAYPNTNIVSVKRHIYDVQNVMYGFAAVYAVISFVLVGIYAYTTKNTVSIIELFSGMFVSAFIAAEGDEIDKLSESVTDFLCGVKREEA